MKNKTILNTSVAAMAAVTTLMSCSKSSNDNSDITGASWTWVSRDGGVANNIHETPASTGKNISLSFGTDGKYTITENGVITSQGTYTRGGGTCIHDLSVKTKIDFSDAAAQDMMIESFTGGRLILSDEANDGLSSTFSR